jgi:hypothetical protein
MADARLARDVTYRNPLETSEFWSSALPQYRHLSLSPSPLCAGAVNFVPFALWAGREGLTINAGLTSRLDQHAVAEYCFQQTHALTSGEVREDTVYVMQVPMAPAFVASARQPVHCVDVDGVSTCFTRRSYTRWQDVFEPPSTDLPRLPELEIFYATLDELYGERMGRQARTTSQSPQQRLTMMLRYWWYRTGGCTHEAAVQKTLAPAPDDVRICGQPYRQRRDPSQEELYDLHRRMLETPSSGQHGAWATHVDNEGEVVWTHHYITGRLNGRDAYGARVEVLNAIAALTGIR